jgi:type II secretory pathway pseudopilin PulG
MTVSRRTGPVLVLDQAPRNEPQLSVVCIRNPSRTRSRRDSERIGISPLPSATLRTRHGGFTYLAVLFLLALAAITATATAIVWRIEHQREQEAELLFAGAEIARAIESYRAVAPNAPQPWPRSLDDLLRDPRTPGVRRHLRKVYRDPVNRSGEWGLIRTQEGGIVGVHSLSIRTPVRTVPAAGLTMREPGRYAGWLFTARGAPAIVRDARSGMWMASGPPSAASAPDTKSPLPGQPASPAGAAEPATPPGPVPGATGSTVAPSASVAPGTGTSKPEPRPDLNPDVR